jgi:hypothetical protein
MRPVNLSITHKMGLLVHDRFDFSMRPTSNVYLRAYIRLSYTSKSPYGLPWPFPLGLLGGLEAF